MQSQWQKQKQWKVHSLLTIAGGPLAASRRRAPRILATYLSSRSRPALAVGNRSAGGCQTGFAASIFNALPGRPIGALPPAHPTPAGRAGGPGDARCVWLSACPRGRGDGAGWAQSQRGTGSASEPTPSHAMSESTAPRVAFQPGNWWFPAGSVLWCLRPPRHGHSRGPAPDSLPSLMPTAPFTSLD